jgi:hypothetical protein
MRKLVSSVLLLLILLNVMGYYGLLLGLQYKNSIDFVRQLDAGVYNRDDAMTLKVPYRDSASSATNFGDTDRSLEREGEMYRFVKQRLYQDTFHIVVVKDKRGTALRNTLSDYVKTFRDAPSDDGKQLSILPLLIKDYYKPNFRIAHVSPGWQCDVRQESCPAVFLPTFCSSIVHPPERSNA